MVGLTLDELLDQEGDAGTISVVSPKTDDLRPVQQDSFSLDELLSEQGQVDIERDIQSGNIESEVPMNRAKRVFDTAPALLRNLPNMIRAYSAWRGIAAPAEFKDIPNEDLGINLQRGATIMSQFLIEPTDEGRARIIKRNIPNAELVKSPSGVNSIRVGENIIPINRPGVSGQDFIDVAGSIAQFLPLAKVASGVTKGAGLLTQSTAQFVGAAATSGTTQTISTMLDNIDNPSVNRMVMEGLGAAGGELVGKLVGTIFKKVAGGGVLSSEDVAQLKSAGIDPASLSPQMVKRITKSREFGSAVERFRLAQGESLPIAIPQTAGNISDLGAKRAFEQKMFSGRLGQKPKDMIDEFFQTQDQRINENFEHFMDEIGLGAQLSPVEAGARIQRKLSDMKAIQGEAFKNAYAEASLDRALLPNSYADDLSKRFDLALNDNGIVPAEVKNFAAIQNQIDQFRSTPVVNLVEMINKSVMDKRFSDHERLRKFINTSVIDAAENKTQRRAGVILKNELDNLMDDYVTASLMGGDEAVVEAAKQARSKFASFKRAFESGDTIEDLTASVNGTSRLVVDPDDAINLIFNKNGLKKKGEKSTVDKLKDILPAREFSLLKQAKLERLAEKSLKTGKLNAPTLKKNWENALKEQPQLMNSLYTAQEKKTLSSFLDIASRIQTRGVSSSVAGNTLLKKGMIEGERSIMKFPLLTSIMDAVTGSFKTFGARNALSGDIGRMLPSNVSVPAVAPAIGASGQRLNNQFEEEVK